MAMWFKSAFDKQVLVCYNLKCLRWHTCPKGRYNDVNICKSTLDMNEKQTELQSRSALCPALTRTFPFRPIRPEGFAQNSLLGWKNNVIDFMLSTAQRPAAGRANLFSAHCACLPGC